MTRRDWLLLLVGDGLDPLRIQKGMFLFAMEADAPEAQRYAFEPYNWGPFAQPIYTDLERLEADGLVERAPVPGATYFKYQQTAAGREAANRVADRADPTIVGTLREARTEVTRYDFATLLRRVYGKYPQYAEKSLFKTPQF